MVKLKSARFICPIPDLSLLSSKSNPEQEYCPPVPLCHVITCLHCNENPIYVFPEKELPGLSPNFHIHVSVSDLYIPSTGPHIFLQQNMQTDRRNRTYINRSQTRECGNWD
jgi:hypothetical protein